MTQQYETVQANQVQVGDYVVNLGKIDIAKGSSQHLGMWYIASDTDRGAYYPPAYSVLIHERPKFRCIRSESSMSYTPFEVFYGDLVIARFTDASDATLYIASKQTT